MMRIKLRVRGRKRRDRERERGGRDKEDSVKSQRERDEQHSKRRIREEKSNLREAESQTSLTHKKTNDLALTRDKIMMERAYVVYNLPTVTIHGKISCLFRKVFLSRSVRFPLTFPRLTGIPGNGILRVSWENLGSKSSIFPSRNLHLPLVKTPHDKYILTSVKL